MGNGSWNMLDSIVREFVQVEKWSILQLMGDISLLQDDLGQLGMADLEGMGGDALSNPGEWVDFV